MLLVKMNEFYESIESGSDTNRVFEMDKDEHSSLSLLHFVSQFRHTSHKVLYVCEELPPKLDDYHGDLNHVECVNVENIWSQLSDCRLPLIVVFDGYKHDNENIFKFVKEINPYIRTIDYGKDKTMVVIAQLKEESMIDKLLKTYNNISDDSCAIVDRTVSINRDRGWLQSLVDFDEATPKSKMVYVTDDPYLKMLGFLKIISKEDFIEQTVDEGPTVYVLDKPDCHLLLKTIELVNKSLYLKNMIIVLED